MQALNPSFRETNNKQFAQNLLFFVWGPPLWKRFPIRAHHGAQQDTKPATFSTTYFKFYQEVKAEQRSK